MTTRQLCMLFAFLIASVTSLSRGENLIRGGDFAGEVGRANWGDRLGEIVPSNRPGAPAGEMMFETKTPAPVWKATKHTAAVPAGTARLRLSCHASGIGLTPPAAADWRRAQFQVALHDAYGRLIRDWQSISLPTGDSDWAEYTLEIECPPDVAVAMIYVGNNHVAGTSRFANLSLEAIDAHDRPLPTPPPYRADTGNWYALSASPDAPAQNSVIDLSRFLDAPAGKHGFLGVKDGHFVFENGKRARFWGVNIGADACFPDHATADRVANSLAKMGVNLVRLHHMDAPWSSWNIFTPGGKSEGKPTTALSDESLERLDYLIAQLKARGIYIYMDLLVHRQVTEEEIGGPVPPNGLKIVALYNRRAIELQKQYAEQLLTHQNRYTKLRYVDDPAIAMSEIINESTFFDGFAGVPQPYLDELSSLFDGWCRRNNIARPAGSMSDLLGAKDPSVGRFFVETQIATWQEIRSHLRSIGYRVPIAGTNWNPTFGNLQANAAFDYIDAHGYWDHPSGGWHWSTQDVMNASILSSGTGGAVDETARSRIAGLPFIVTEWNHCWPNQYVAEGPIVWASVAALQDWDGLVQFAYGNRPAARVVMDNAFDIASAPQQLATRYAAALMFHRRDLVPAESTVVGSLAVADKAALADKAWSVLPAGASFTQKLELDPSGRNDRPAAPRESPLRFDSNALHYQIQTPRTVGWIGRPTSSPKRAGIVSFEQRSPFAVVTVSSLDDQPIEISKRLLITAVGDAQNTGQVMNSARSRVLEIGTLPVLMEPIEGTLSLGRSTAPTAYQLDHSGVRTGKTLPITQRESGWSVDLAAARSPWIEIVYP